MLIDAQLAAEDFETVQMPRKMISAQMQEFDLLSAQQQEVVKVASTFKAFTPVMLINVINDSSQKMDVEELKRVSR